MFVLTNSHPNISCNLAQQTLNLGHGRVITSIHSYSYNYLPLPEVSLKEAPGGFMQKFRQSIFKLKISEKMHKKSSQTNYLTKTDYITDIEDVNPFQAKYWSPNTDILADVIISQHWNAALNWNRPAWEARITLYYIIITMINWPCKTPVAPFTNMV